MVARGSGEGRMRNDCLMDTQFPFGVMELGKNDGCITLEMY